MVQFCSATMNINVNTKSGVRFPTKHTADYGSGVGTITTILTKTKQYSIIILCFI